MKNDRSRRSNSALSGLFSSNPLFVSGLAAAPAIVYAYTLEKAVILAAFFSALTFVTLIISALIPRKVLYTTRIILYTFIGACVYVPLCIFAESRFPGMVSDMGIYAPMLIVNPFIVSRSDTLFFRKKGIKMFAGIITYIIGYDLAVILLGFIRELMASGGINGSLYDIKYTVSGLSYSYGGFILLGLIAALVRFIALTAEKYRKR